MVLLNKTIIVLETEAMEDNDAIIGKMFDIIDGFNETSERISSLSIFEEMETSR